MKKIFITFLAVFITYSAYSQQMQFDWVTQAGSSGWDVVTGMTGLPDGKIVIAGAYYESIAFQGVTLNSKGSRDGFIAVFKADGSFYKAISMGGPGFDYVQKTGIREGSGLVATLRFNEKFKIGNSQVTAKYPNNCLVAFFDNDLSLTAQTILGGNSDFDLTGLQSEPGGDFCFSGWFTDTLAVDGKNYISRNDENIFAGQVSSNGKFEWFKQYDAEGSDKPFSLKKGDPGINYLAGTTMKGNFEGKKQPPAIASGMEHLFISSFDNSGVTGEIVYPVYGKEIVPVEILKDSSTLWILANFRYSAFINGVELVSYGMSDVLLVKYNLQDKKTVWCQIGGFGNEEAAGLVKSGKHIFVAGQFSDKLTFAGQTVTADKASTGIFVASVSGDGIPRSIATITGAGSKFPCAVFASGTGIYVAGEFTGSLKAGASEFKSAGKEDIFLARIENCETKDPLHISSILADAKKGGSGWELDAGPGFASYSWDNNVSASRYFVTGQPGTHSVKVTDNKGCVYTGEVNVSKTKSAQIISETQPPHEFRLFPSITGGFVYWEPSTDWINGNAVVRVFDSSGKLISQKEIREITEATYRIDFSTEPDGSYVVEIAGEGFREISKVVVKK